MGLRSEVAAEVVNLRGAEQSIGVAKAGIPALGEGADTGIGLGRGPAGDERREAGTERFDGSLAPAHGKGEPEVVHGDRRLAAKAGERRGCGEEIGEAEGFGLGGHVQQSGSST